MWRGRGKGNGNDPMERQRRRERERKRDCQSRRNRGFVPSYYSPPQPWGYYYIFRRQPVSTVLVSRVRIRRQREAWLIVFILLNHFPSFLSPWNFRSRTKDNHSPCTRPPPSLITRFVFQTASCTKNYVCAEV